MHHVPKNEANSNFHNCRNISVGRCLIFEDIISSVINLQGFKTKARPGLSRPRPGPSRPKPEFGPSRFD